MVTHGNVRHPAPYSKTILEALESLILAEQRRLKRPIRVLDPLAGLGRIHQLRREGRVETYGVEIEDEWAICHPRTATADSVLWMELAGHLGRIPNLWGGASDRVEPFDVIACSPPYANRFSDSHNAQDGSERRSYTHDLGRQLTAGNSGSMAWGQRYWLWCARLYRALPNVLAPEGLVLWNVSDIVKAKTVVPAVTFHRGAMYGAGLVEDKPARLVTTPRMTYGANRERAESEVIMRLRPVGADVPRGTSDEVPA